MQLNLTPDQWISLLLVLESSDPREPDVQAIDAIREKLRAEVRHVMFSAESRKFEDWRNRQLEKLKPLPVDTVEKE